MLRRHFFSLFGTVPALWSMYSARGVEPSSAPPNWQTATLGGLQYWSDEQIFHRYRIQRNVATGHFRLLDGSDERLAWGTFEQCCAKLDEIKREERLKPLPKRVVLTLHGIIRSRHSMAPLAEYLREQEKTPVYQVGYSSTQQSIPQAAATLDRLICRLEGVEEIDVVAFSMGNLVLRHWIGDVLAAAKKDAGAVATDAQVAAVGDAPVTPTAEVVRRPKLRRCVMIGPPNNGAARAQLWQDSTVGRELFSLVLGEAGEQLGARFNEIKDHLAAPEGEFGIIAGGKGDADGWHDGIPGDDDGTVGVEETKVPGAADFAIVPVRHTWLVSDRRVQTMVYTFLKHGYFRSAQERQPLAK